MKNGHLIFAVPVVSEYVHMWPPYRSSVIISRTASQSRPSSSYAPSQLADLIAAQDVAAVQRIPGVGKKTASRIILELKGSLDQGIGGLFGQDERVVNQALEGAKEALLSMGFTTGEIDLALKGAPEDGTESSLLQYALKKLGA